MDGDFSDQMSETTEEIWRGNDKALLEEDEEGFESDIQLMEGLFDKPEKRY